MELLCAGFFKTLAKAIDYLRDNPLAVMLLDIEMPEQKGLSLTSDMLDIPSDREIVFITAYNQYAIETFECNALDYIAKPLTARLLQKTIARKGNVAWSVKTQHKPHIRCFGSFELLVDEQAVAWRNTKAKEALALLVQRESMPVSWAP